MQDPGDNSVTVDDPHVENYADNNLNDKNLGTQYIYTTEGQLIPTTPEQISSNMDSNSQHFNAVDVTEAQSLHIEQVDYQFQQQYSDDTVQEVVPVSDSSFTAEDQTATYIIDQNSYIATNSREVLRTSEQQAYTNQEETETPSQSVPYVYETGQLRDCYASGKTVVTDSELISNQQNNQEKAETCSNVLETITKSDTLNSNVVEVTSKDIESATTISEGTVITEVNQDITASTEKVMESGDSLETDEMKDTQVLQNVDLKSVREEVALSPTHNEEKTKCELENKELEKPFGNHHEENQPQIQEESYPSINPSNELKQSVMVRQEIGTEQDVRMTAPKAEEIREVRTQDITTIAIDDNTYLESAPLEEDQAYLGELKSETDSRNSTSSTDPSQNPRPRGRKQKTEIPLHILGHDVNKPMENIVNGKTPKPRLGVKVPYRHLTSQIVSKEELEREIVERGRKKQEEKKDELIFARQLTSRLAKKIAPEPTEKVNTVQSKQNSKKGQSVPTEVELVMEQECDQMEENSNDERKETIDNNSDLLAILEGDGDAEDLPLMSKETELQAKESTPTDETNLKNLEREIALQQLQDLPYLSPSTRFVKGRTAKELPVSLSEGKSVNQVGKPSSTMKQNSVKEKCPTKTSPVKQIPDKAMDVEPQIKVNMALKTYSRKRKSSDSVTELAAASPSKKTTSAGNTFEIDLKPNIPTSTTGDVYVTKSSRVIKKKVIWDPDESIPSRISSAKFSHAKVESPSSTKVTSKPVQPKNETRSADLPKKPAVEAKIKTEKKAEEKPSKKSAASPVDRRTSPSSKVTVKPKKIRSEVDKLLGDEGAIKMLYELKTSEDHVEEKKKKTVISVEKTFKELAKKANQIKSDLVNTTAVESPKSLRKKESVVSPVSSAIRSTPLSIVPSGISRQKSKDSSRSTPPPSPTFSFPIETSYLIRRRSSSSISSGDDTGGSMEFDDLGDKTSRKKAASTILTNPLKIKKAKGISCESEKSQKRAENRIGHYQTFHFKKLNRSIAIDLHTQENSKCYFTSELLGELTTALNKISKEKDCNVVLIRSTQSSIFCRGLNYKEIISDKDSVRKDKASELAGRVSKFIKCLLDFPKILIAGIQGECVGLAVTMLPLFDIVIGSDCASFSAPYSALGSVAEAGFLLTVPYIASHGLGELLYAGQKLTADEAFRRGLISKLCWPEKYQDTVKSTVSLISKGSKQSLEATKKQLRTSIRENTAVAINAMSNDLVDHWTSNECQSNFAKIGE